MLQQTKKNLVIELSKFPWLDFNRCGGSVRCTNGKTVIWRIGMFKARNGSSVVRIALERDSSGQKMPVKFLDQTGPIGPSRTREDMSRLSRLRSEKMLDIRKKYTDEQKEFIQTIEDLVSDYFSDEECDTDRISECFCMATLEDRAESVYVFQAISADTGKRSSYLERKLTDWRFENTDLSFDSSDFEEAAGIYDTGRVLDNVIGRVSRICSKLVKTFSISDNINLDLSDLNGTFFSRYSTYTVTCPEDISVVIKNTSEKGKSRLFKHKASKLRTVYSMLKSGNQVPAETLAGAAYGSTDDYAQAKMRRLISHLRKLGGMDIVVEKGTYRLKGVLDETLF